MNIVILIIAILCIGLVFAWFLVARADHDEISDFQNVTLDEIVAELDANDKDVDKVQFKVHKSELDFDPDYNEVVFYRPKPSPQIEQAITDNLEEIKALFKDRGFVFSFLPDLIRQLSYEEFYYFNPRSDKVANPSEDILTYSDIKAALRIPDTVIAPCLIRCRIKHRDFVSFSFVNLDLSEERGVVETVKDYLNGQDVIVCSRTDDDDIRSRLAGRPADARFDEDVFLLGKEIRERVDKLRAKGLSSLAIRRLIGDDSDKPGKLLIDKHNKLILTDYGNKEIKLSPIHKAVFFLFLRHPEGIYFKDLPDYRDELSAIYKEITGREDLEGIEDSLDKLTDPFNNSINEKCARIKNAFVSEFREEVAKWYFIDGTKGERKSIKLPRDLVTWEIQD